MYQYPVSAWEKSTVIWVIPGSEAPPGEVANCLSTPAKTGTMNTTRAIITPIATVTTTEG